GGDRERGLIVDGARLRLDDQVPLVAGGVPVGDHAVGRAASSDLDVVTGGVGLGPADGEARRGDRGGARRQYRVDMWEGGQVVSDRAGDGTRPGGGDRERGLVVDGAGLRLNDQVPLIAGDVPVRDRAEGRVASGDLHVVTGVVGLGPAVEDVFRN